MRVAIVRSRFNELITQRLLKGAEEALRHHGVESQNVSVHHVPGAVELAFATDQLLRHLPLDAVVCLGAVILGETRHFDYVCKLAAEGILQVQLTHGVPVSFGVLTCNTMEQAMQRSGVGGANRGFDAAEVAIEMAEFKSRLENGSGQQS